MNVTELHRIVPRNITEKEIQFFKKHNWVKLDQLIPEEDALSLLDRLKSKMGDAADKTLAGDSASDEMFARFGSEVLFKIWGPLAVDCATGEVADELFFGLSHSPELGKIAQQLVGHRVRYWVDQSMVKVGDSSVTHWHQDSGSDDRSVFAPNDVQYGLWLALDYCPPERGAMRFVSQDQADTRFRRIIAEESVSESYPKLEELGIISPPFDLRPGDATIHGSAVFHSAPANTTDEPRWAYLVSLFREDATWTGRDHWPLAGVQGMKIGNSFPEARFRRLPVE